MFKVIRLVELSPSSLADPLQPQHLFAAQPDQSGNKLFLALRCSIKTG